VIVVENPERLIDIPDSLNIYLNESISNYFDFVKSSEYSLIPDTLLKKITGKQFDYISYLLS